MIDKKKMKKYVLRHKTMIANNLNIYEDLCNYLTTNFFGLVLNDPILYIGMYLYIPLLVMKFDMLSSDTQKFNNNLFNIMNENDDEYLKIRELYKKYVSNIAAYIKRMNITDPIEVGMFFTIMLSSGVFSSDRRYNYKKEKNCEDIFYPQILGAKILTGIGVCRNSSALLNDIYNELGYESMDISVSTKKYLKSSNHAVVMVKNDKGSIIIDPTSCAIGILDEKSKKCSNVISFLGVDTDKHYYLKNYVENGNMIDFNDNVLNNIKVRKIDNNEISGKFMMIFLFCRNLINGNENIDDSIDLQEFIDENNEQMKIINSDYTQLIKKKKRFTFRKH